MGSISNPNVNTISKLPSTNSISDPATNSISTPYPQVINDALVNLNEEGIVKSGINVTAWTNSGTGGSAYDLDVVVGAAANLTHDTQLGHTVVSSSGSAGLRPTAGQLIASGNTIFIVARFSNASPSANQVLLSSRSDPANTTSILTENAVSDRFTLEQGSALILVAPYDNDPHLFTGQLNGDATSKFTVSSVGNVTGNAGSDGWDYCTLFANRVGGETAAGYVANLLVFDRALTDSEIAQVQAYLESEYNL